MRLFIEERVYKDKLSIQTYDRYKEYISSDIRISEVQREFVSLDEYEKLVQKLTLATKYLKSLKDDAKLLGGLNVILEKLD